MRGKSQKERAQDRIHSSEGYQKGESGKEILLTISAGLAMPAAFLMPTIPLFHLFFPLVVMDTKLQENEHALYEP